MKIHYLQHIFFETPATIVDWAREKGYKLTGTHLYNYEALPNIDDFDWLIIMGGPMNIYEEEKYPWLKNEKKLIKKAIDSGKFVIGICLGAQLITDVLNGKVTKNPYGEIGWLPIEFNDKALGLPIFKNFPEISYVFQWHNDTFSTLGEACKSIASSEACKNQGFIYKDRVIGFQFHMESSKGSILELIKNCSEEIIDGPYIQTAEQIEENMEYIETANFFMDEFLNNLESCYINLEE